MNWVLIFFSLIAAMVPMVSYMIVIWRLDRHDREPVWLVSLNFAWGAFGAVMIGIIIGNFFEKSFSGIIFNSQNKDTLSSILTAPFIEELAKAVFLIFVTAPYKDFDNMTDGIVYGAAIGLGFGMTENFLYFLNVGTVQEWLILVPMRSILSAVMHACSTSAFGAFVGYSKFQPKEKKNLLIPLGLLTAMIIHFTWNFSVTVGSGKFTLIGIIFIFISVFIMSILFKFSLSIESKLIKQELTEETKISLIPDEHLNYLPYTHLRNKPNWLPDNINQIRYIRITTILAFRKQQYKNCSKFQKAFYEKEIEDAREEITHILHNGPI
jgi:RsiW-degrading membrane proteinase PrsW (M82 family)